MIHKINLLLYLLYSKFDLIIWFYRQNEFTMNKITSINYVPLYIEIKNNKNFHFLFYKRGRVIYEEDK